MREIALSISLQRIFSLQPRMYALLDRILPNLGVA
jgi:hypothetical protein